MRLSNSDRDYLTFITLSILAIVGMIALGLFMVLPVWLIWNLVAPVFGLPTLGYWQAVGVVVFLNVASNFVINKINRIKRSRK